MVPNFKLHGMLRRLRKLSSVCISISNSMGSPSKLRKFQNSDDASGPTRLEATLNLKSMNIPIERLVEVSQAG